MTKNAYYARPSWFPGEETVILAGNEAVACTVLHDNGLNVLIVIEGWLFVAIWHYDDGVLILAPDNVLEAPVLSMPVH